MTNQTGRAGGDAGGPSSKSAGGKNRNDTIECLLNLRSVRDQFKDAELDLSNDKVAQQLRELEDQLVDHLAEERELRDGVGLLTVAVVGDFNSGKSTFINALLGTKLCPVGDEPTTASVTHFIHGDAQRFELERDGTRTSIAKGKYLSMVRHGKVGDREAYRFHASVDSPVLEHIRLVDTPGFNAPPPNSNDTRVTEAAVADADALFVIADAHKGNPSKTLLEQLDRLRNTRKNESGPLAFLLLNKAENMPPGDRNDAKSESQKQYHERFRNVTLVSAMRLNDTDDAAPLDTLETTTRRIRTALSRQESFDARISATVVTERRGQTTYRVDIDGNVHEAGVSPNGDLASREQLLAMVRSVTAERHTFLETQFRRRTSQLRKDWSNIAADLESLCKRAARTSSDGGEPTNERRNEALKEIDNAKDHILDRAGRIFQEVAEDLVPENQEVAEDENSGSLSDTTYYVIVDLGVARSTVAKHSFWGQIETILKNLIVSLNQETDIGAMPGADKIAVELKGHGVDIVRKSLMIYGREFKNLDNCKRLSEERYRLEYKRGWLSTKKDIEALRVAEYNRRRGAYREDANRWTLDFSRSLQSRIDELQECVIMDDEERQATVRERDDELTKLQERIEELKEYTPCSA